MKKRIIPFLALFLLFTGCSLLDSQDTGKTKIKDELPRPLTAQEKELINAGNAFSYEIFRHISASEGNENIIISPLSISMALGMALNGSAGETREAMKKTLGVSALELEQINKSYQSLIKLLVNLDPKVKMKIANSIWSDKGFPMLPLFLERLKTYFNATAQELDFRDPASADIINNWVKKNTNGKIEKIVEAIPGGIVAFLINAVYFKGDWLYQFNPGKTEKQDFTLASGSTVKVNMMQQEAEVAYYRSEDVTMVELPYGNSLYRMTILLPAPSSQPLSLNQFINKHLNQASMRKWIDNLEKTEDVIIKMPKFDFNYKKTLNGILKTMGMGIAFSPRKANFSNMSPAQIFISKVKHKAAITVDEKGTEAAAVTSVSIGITSVQPNPKIVLNRPFVFLIREKVSGTILFMGQVYNPAKK